MIEDFNKYVKELVFGVDTMIKDVFTWTISFAACLAVAAIFIMALKLTFKVLAFAWKLV